MLHHPALAQGQQSGHVSISGRALDDKGMQECTRARSVALAPQHGSD
jgi:hypothetical protein